MLQFNAVESKKHKHRVCTDPLVSIYEGMVFNRTKAESCRFLLQRWIYIFSAKV